ncbi:MAG: NUDIX hydrolase [Deltaproteobacteria bacterium]|nr:NUDIX hydrolase [Deltaproteobacteria bacterium]
MKIIHQGKYLNFIQEGRWEYVKRNNCSGIVSIFTMTPEKILVFTEQYRVPLKKWVIEFPAGLVGDIPEASQENLEQAALREMEEEIGYTAEKLIYLFEGPPSAGLSGETIHFYKAENMKKIGTGGGDESEQIVVHEIPLDNIDVFLGKKMKEGVWIDPKFYAGLYFMNQMK